MQSTYQKKSNTLQNSVVFKADAISDSSTQSESLQRKADMANNAAQRAEAPRPNNTGMPDNLKSGIESLSGFSMDDVRVHYNSSKPAAVQALAYTQGTDIHVAPGQEKHLPHEAWHVAQQMAGRVATTTNINGMPVNDNAELEHEADMMGEKATQCKKKESQRFSACMIPSKNMIQRIVLDRSKKICLASDDSIPEKKEESEETEKGKGKGKKTPIKKIELSTPSPKKSRLEETSFVKYFNSILEKIEITNEIKIDKFTKAEGTEYKWDKIYLKNKKNLVEITNFPIKVKDIFDDYPAWKTDVGRYDKGKACVLQALYAAEKALGLIDKKTSIKDYHEQFASNNEFNYKSDMGAFFLYTNMEYQNVKEEFPGVRTLQEFLTRIGSADDCVYLLLQNQKGGTEGHAIAVVRGEVIDEQNRYTNKSTHNSYEIKNIYAKKRKH